MFTGLKRAASIPGILRDLRRMGPATPEQIVAYLMAKPLIVPSQVPAELRRFAELVAELRPRRVLEIGTCKGGTLCVLCRLAAPDATIVSLDLPGGAYGGGYDAKRALVFRAFPRRGQRLHLVRGDSHLPQIRERVARALGGEPLDLLFIDGDHSYAGVKADYEMYSPMVRAGGLIGFHDIVEHPPELGVGVGRFWREIRGPGAVEIIADPGQGWAGIGALRR